MRRIQKNNLTGKMTIRMLKGLGAGIFIVLLLYFGGTEILYPYIVTSKHSSRMEMQYIEVLQEYVTEYNLSTGDYDELRSWVEQENLDKMTIVRGKWLVFDSSYSGEIAAGAREVSQQSLQVYYTVDFSDGEAEVYVDDGYAQKYYNILLGISIVAGLAVCLMIFVIGMHEDIVTIQRMEREVSVISQGNLEHGLTVSGEDELADLASGIDRMRLSLKEKEQKETEMRRAQEKLVLGMSHDLRTPLTGLMTYMEILKQQQKDGRVTEEFLSKAMDKIQQIRGLSDEMFEYFFVTSNKEPVLEDPERIESVFGDYLSEICSLLECSGFICDSGEIEWRPVCVRVNMDYLGRIFNNIISNLEKYADKSEAVVITFIYEKERVGIRILNAAASHLESVSGTGIGTKNISIMMEQMYGEMQSEMMENRYQITLYFPICS